MNYKKEIKNLVDQIDNQTVLRLLYYYVLAGIKENKKKEKT